MLVNWPSLLSSQSQKYQQEEKDNVHSRAGYINNRIVSRTLCTGEKVIHTAVRYSHTIWSLVKCRRGELRHVGAESHTMSISVCRGDSSGEVLTSAEGESRAVIKLC